MLWGPGALPPGARALVSATPAHLLIAAMGVEGGLGDARPGRLANKSRSITPLLLSEATDAARDAEPDEPGTLCCCAMVASPRAASTPARSSCCWSSSSMSI